MVRNSSTFYEFSFLYNWYYLYSKKKKNWIRIMSKKSTAYQLSSFGISRMSETEKKLLISIVKIELSNNPEWFDLENLSAEERELVSSILEADN